MNWKIKLSDTIINYILAATGASSIAYALFSSFMYSFSAMPIIILVFAIMMFLTAGFYNKIITIVFGVLIGIFLIFIGVQLFNPGKLDNTLRFVNDYTNWVYDYANGYLVDAPQYKLLTVFLLCLAVSIVFYAFTINRFNFYVIAFSGLAVFAVQHMYKIMVTTTPFYVFIFLVIIYYMKHTYNRKISKSQDGYARPLAFFLNILPISVLVIVLAMLLPIGNTPFHWKWYDDRVNQIAAVFGIYEKNGQGFGDFNFSKTGFGGSERALGGKVSLDKTHVLTVQAPRSNIYLKGSIKDIYTGSSWTKSSDLEGDQPFRQGADDNEIIRPVK